MSSMENWLLLWENRQEFWDGLLTTLQFFILASFFAFILGCIFVYLLEDSRAFVRKSLIGFTHFMRMIPFLMLVYIIYYGSPNLLGFNIDAWWTGLLALIIYHAAYLTELLRGSRTLLPKGNVEAAYAYGFSKFKLYIRIILPQLLMRVRPMLGSQLIYCLKDTAFLNIITITELTAAANSVQSVYSIPIEAFLVAIGLYWLMNICIELIIKKCAVFGQKRGIEHV